MNYPLVGAFVLTLAALLVLGVLWLAAGGAFQTRYDLYQATEDESVAGLNLNAPVKYNGVDVGKVRQIHLDPLNPALVHLLFAIERGTPIKVDTVAVLRTQGLTGIAYVELSGGARDAELLRAIPPNRYPVIQTKPSLSARLENVLTNVLAKLDDTSSSINAILSAENHAAFGAVVGASGSAWGELRLDTELVRLQHDFQARPSQVVLTLRATLTQDKARRVLAVRQFEARVPSASEDPRGGVQAANLALQQVLTDLSTFLSEAAANLPRVD